MKLQIQSFLKEISLQMYQFKKKGSYMTQKLSPPFSSASRANSLVSHRNPQWPFPGPSSIHTLVASPKHLVFPRAGSCFACGKFGHFRSQCPVLNCQSSVNQPNRHI